MKNLLIALLTAAAIALGGFTIYQNKQLARSRNDLAALQQRLKDAEDQIAEQAAAAERAALAERKAKVLQETLSQASKVSADQSKQVAQLQNSLATVKTNSSGFTELFKDPAMKEMIKAQQKAFIGPMIQKNYADFFKQLNLTSEQADHLKELLQQKMLVSADQGMALLDGTKTPEELKQAGKDIKAETDALDQSIKEFLGDENYKNFKEYETSLPSRMSLNQFRDQVAGSESRLDAAQEQQLLNAMQDTRSSFKWTTDYQKNSGDGNFAEMFNEDRMNKHFQEQIDYDNQLVERAKSFMNGQQLTAFQEFLKTQRTMQEAGLKMAAKMFGAQNGSGAGQ